MTKPVSFVLVLIFFVFGFISCKKSKLSKPTDITFKIDINRAKSANGKLVFNSGTIFLAEFEIEGERVEGEDIAFSRSFDNGLVVVFDPDKEIPELDYDIPQGEYERLRISFDTFEDNADKTLVVKGTYTNSSGINLPIVFEFMSSEFFSITAEAADGSNTITLDKDIPANSTIKLDPIHWFGGISTTTLDNANLTDVDGTSTILINDEINGNIYDLVADKIDESTEAIFK